MFQKLLYIVFTFSLATTYAQQDEMDFFLSCKVLSKYKLAHESEPCGKELISNNLQANGVNVVIRRYETSQVATYLINGLKFHIADYSDTTRVVTALDGEKAGYQGVSVGGIKTAESTKVDWQKNYFIHNYASGRIFSYPDKQIIEHY